MRDTISPLQALLDWLKLFRIEHVREPTRDEIPAHLVPMLLKLKAGGPAVRVSEEATLPKLVVATREHSPASDDDETCIASTPTKEIEMGETDRGNTVHPRSLFQCAAQLPEPTQAAPQVPTLPAWARRNAAQTKQSKDISTPRDKAGGAATRPTTFNPFLRAKMRGIKVAGDVDKGSLPPPDSILQANTSDIAHHDEDKGSPGLVRQGCRRAKENKEMSLCQPREVARLSEAPSSGAPVQTVLLDQREYGALPSPGERSNGGSLANSTDKTQGPSHQGPGGAGTSTPSCIDASDLQSQEEPRYSMADFTLPQAEPPSVALQSPTDGPNGPSNANQGGGVLRCSPDLPDSPEHQVPSSPPRKCTLPRAPSLRAAAAATAAAPAAAMSVKENPTTSPGEDNDMAVGGSVTSPITGVQTNSMIAFIAEDPVIEESADDNAPYQDPRVPQKQGASRKVSSQGLAASRSRSHGQNSEFKGDSGGSEGELPLLPQGGKKMCSSHVQGF